MNEGAVRALEVLQAHAAAMSEALVSGAGPDVVIAVFAGGSLASGNIAWFQGEDLEIYSDVDLYAVVADADADADFVRDSAAAARELPPPPGVRLLRAMDVGVYTRSDLMNQPARPGTVGLRRHRMTLHGEPAAIAAMVAAIGTEIDPAEGLYLLENRIREFRSVAAVIDGPEVRLRRYLRVKTVLDTVAAVRVAQRRYGDGDGAEAAVADMSRAGQLPGGWDGELVAASLAAASDLPRFLRSDGEAVITDERVTAMLLAGWHGVAERLLDCSSSDWATLLLRRCRAGDYVANFREFMAMGSSQGRLRARVAWSGAGMARYSAVSALRLGGLVDAVLTLGLVDDIGMRSLDGLRAYLDRLTNVFGFCDGHLADRVDRMHHALSGG